MKIQHVILAGAFTALTFAAPASAEVSTNLPGMQCVATTSIPLNTTDNGEAENPSTTGFAQANCPVERPIAPTVTTKLSAKIFVVDRHPTNNVCCSVNSRNPSGAIVASALVCSTGSSASYQQLNIAQITDTATYSQFNVFCLVPPASGGNTSRIQTYRPIVE